MVHFNLLQFLTPRLAGAVSVPLRGSRPAGRGGEGGGGEELEGVQMEEDDD